MIVFFIVCVGIALLAAYVGMYVGQGFNFTFNKTLYLKYLGFSGIFTAILYVIAMIIFLRQVQL